MMQSQKSCHEITNYNNIREDITIASTEMIAYVGEPATPQETAQCLKILSISFPDMPPEFFDILNKMIIRENISGLQLGKAVENLLCNHRYRTFTIAEIIGFNPKIKLYEWQDIYKMHGEYPYPGYLQIRIQTKRGEIKKIVKTEDAKMYNLDIIREY